MPKGSKVLMADDDKMLLDMYKERLELAGYVVQSYYNGEDAVAHVHDFAPDIIMLDVMMPKMNGYETLASLKSDPTTKNIPVVMLSALMRDFNREKAVEGGAEDYLIKSEAMPSDVITKIEQVLQKFGKGSTPVPGTDSSNQPSPMPQPTQPQAAQPPSVEPMVAPAQDPTPTPNQLDQTTEPTLPEPNPDNSLEGKVFSTTSPDMQNTNIESANADQQKNETLVFEPVQNAQVAATEAPKPQAEEVATVTEIAPPPVAPGSAVPESPLAEDTTMEDVARSNWVVPAIITLMAILLIGAAVAFYFGFIKK